MSSSPAPQICSLIAGERKLPSSFLFGPTIGTYQGKKIYDYITDNHGVVRHYAGIVTSLTNCKPDSIILGSGLLYEVQSPSP